MNYLAVFTLFTKEIERVWTVWKQTVIAPAITNILFMVVFGVALASRVSPFEGVTYMQVLIPGLVAMAIMNNALQNVMSSLIIAKYTNNISHLMTLPIRGYEMAISYIMAGLVRGGVVGMVTLIVGMFFSSITFKHPLLIVFMSLVIGVIFSSVGALIGVFSPDFDKASVIPSFILTPLIYMGGVFYTVSSLPPSFAAVSKFNPILYMVDALRFGFIGVGDISIVVSVSISTAFAVGLFAITSYIFEKGYKLKV